MFRLSYVGANRELLVPFLVVTIPLKPNCVRKKYTGMFDGSAASAIISDAGPKWSISGGLLIADAP
jgi:hypothetical protein